LIWRYELEFLQFVGADLDPSTGLPTDIGEVRRRGMNAESPDHVK
jgi:hypothetical protein